MFNVVIPLGVHGSLPRLSNGVHSSCVGFEVFNGAQRRTWGTSIFKNYHQFEVSKYKIFLGDFDLQELPSRRLQTLWEWKNRVLLEEYYIFHVVIPREVE